MTTGARRVRGLPARFVLDRSVLLTAGELCRICRLTPDELQSLVDEGLVEPEGGVRRPRFSAYSVRRIQLARTLARDLGVNLAGAALACELIEEVERLRDEVERLRFHLR